MPGSPEKADYPRAANGCASSAPPPMMKGILREDMEDLVIGPTWPARNWSSDAGAGSIHDDSTAANLGFRGGTVAGSIHMNQFPPVLMRVFGFRWFEQGNLSLNFKNATIDEEEVQVFAEPCRRASTR